MFEPNLEKDSLLFLLSSIDIVARCAVSKSVATMKKHDVKKWVVITVEAKCFHCNYSPQSVDCTTFSFIELLTFDTGHSQSMHFHTGRLKASPTYGFCASQFHSITNAYSVTLHISTFFLPPRFSDLTVLQTWMNSRVSFAPLTGRACKSLPARCKLPPPLLSRTWS